MTDYKVIISGSIGAGKSTILESITQHLRIRKYKVGVVREFIDAFKDGPKKLSDWITGKISHLQFQDYISYCHLISNEKIKYCPIKVYERSPYESAVIFSKDTYCYRHVLDQANELHTEFKIPYPFKQNVITIDANRNIESVFEDVKTIVDEDIQKGIKERIIYLKVNLENSLQRIKNRGRVSEASYSEGYLQNLIDAYDELYNSS